MNERNTAAISSERPFRFPAHTFANSAGSSVTGKWTRGGTLQASAMTWAVCWADFWQALYAHAKKLREGHAHEADAPHRRPSNFEVPMYASRRSDFRHDLHARGKRRLVRSPGGPFSHTSARDTRLPARRRRCAGGARRDRPLTALGLRTHAQSGIGPNWRNPPVQLRMKFVFPSETTGYRPLDRPGSGRSKHLALAAHRLASNALDSAAPDRRRFLDPRPPLTAEDWRARGPFAPVMLT